MLGVYMHYRTGTPAALWVEDHSPWLSGEDIEAETQLQQLQHWQQQLASLHSGLLNDEPELSLTQVILITQNLSSGSI